MNEQQPRFGLEDKEALAAKHYAEALKSFNEAEEYFNKAEVIVDDRKAKLNHQDIAEVAYGEGIAQMRAAAKLGSPEAIRYLADNDIAIEPQTILNDEIAKGRQPIRPGTSG